jgi:lipoprotein NlpI
VKKVGRSPVRVFAVQSAILALLAAVAFGRNDESKKPRPRIAELTAEIAKTPKSVDLYSKRGDLYFQTGEFAKSLADYEKMVELEPRLDDTHWRKGIALYYLERWEESAKQFEKYQTIDDVDRENGIWRFMAMERRVGLQKAREKLIEYFRPDRPPLTDVYQMFQGTLSSSDFRNKTEPFKPHTKERFYADLYLGIFLDIEGDSSAAVKHLKAAEANEWAKAASGGSGWMWHIAPTHLKMIERRAAKEKKKSAEKKAG